MLKPLFIILFSAFIINTVKGERADTTILYYKYDLQGYYHKVSSLDSADFFLAVLPPDSADDKVNIREYYKNGKLKFIGKSATTPDATFLPNGLTLVGDCISYYPNGKKRNNSHYNKGEKDGYEYSYYPNGKVYYSKKYIALKAPYKSLVLSMDCYDANGSNICKDGNGQWITYDSDFKNVLITGPVKDGYMNGDWIGHSLSPDSIKYIYKYDSKGHFLSSTGYDKEGKAYPFKVEYELADYLHGPIAFIGVFRNHLILPKDTNGKKMSVDTMHISFIIEKDGHVSDFKILGNVNPQLKDALNQALEKCHDWTPSRIYGVPLRTEITLPLDFVHGYVDNSWKYSKEISFKTRIIGY